MGVDQGDAKEAKVLHTVTITMTVTKREKEKSEMRAFADYGCRQPTVRSKFAQSAWSPVWIVNTWSGDDTAW